MNIKFDKIRSRWDVMTTDSAGNSRLVCWISGSFCGNGSSEFFVYAPALESDIPHGFEVCGPCTIASFPYATLWEAVEFAKGVFKL